MGIPLVPKALDELKWIRKGLEDARQWRDWDEVTRLQRRLGDVMTLLGHRAWENNPCAYGCDCGECYSRSPDDESSHHCEKSVTPLITGHDEREQRMAPYYPCCERCKGDHHCCCGRGRYGPGIDDATGRYTCCGTDALRIGAFHAAGCPNR